VTLALSPGSHDNHGFEISVRHLLWLGIAALFVLLRLGPVWQAPVGGAELIHLSGAWQAREGIGDDRYVPSLFQAISAAVLRASSSEVGPRVIAFLADASIPLAVYLLRRTLGELGALLTLLALALDAPALSLGASASALGFDLPLTAWLLVAVVRHDTPGWAWPALTAGVVLSGPIALPLVVSAGGLALYQRRQFDRQTLTAVLAAAVLSVAMASFRFGLGPDGVRIPPLVLFGDSFSQSWSTATGFRAALIYSAPLLLGGAAALLYSGANARRARSSDLTTQLLLAWPIVSLAWFVASGSSHSTAALVSLTTASAFLLGPSLAAAIGVMIRADWRWARLAIPAGGVVAAIALGRIVDWARIDRLPGDSEEFQVAGLALIGASLWGVFALRRETRATLVAPATAIGVLLLVAGVFGVGLSYIEEPLPSPYSPRQARELRDVALDLSATKAGAILIHDSLATEVTWPFRDSGAINFSSRIVPSAAIVIWPRELPAPEGYAIVEGDWALTRSIAPPQGFLQYVHWLSDRNSLTIKPHAVAVYTRKDRP
jgi:hypothetical protein